MKKTKYLFSTLLLIMCSNLLQAQWKKVSSGTTNDLLGLHFPTATTGYVVGKGGTVLKSTDAGNTWTGGAVTGYTTSWFWDVQFKGTDTGFVCGETDPGTNPHGMGLILKTTDGGKTWKSVFFSSLTPVRDLFMVSRDTIYACGGAEMTDGHIWKSTDGGSTWVPYGTTFYDALIGGMYFQNCSRGFWGMYESVGGSYNPVSASWMSTKDGLATVGTDVVPSSPSFWEFATSFPLSTRGYMMRGTYVTTSAVYVRITNDGGTTWTEKATGFFSDVYGMDFCHRDTGFIVGGAGKIWRTCDGASTWAPQTSPVTTDLKEIFCYRNQEAFAVGLEGTIIKLDLGGQAPASIQDASYADKVKLGPNPARDVLHIYGLGEAVRFRITDSRGATIQEGILPKGDQSLFVSGLSSGDYFLELNGNSADRVHRFEVQQ